MIEIQVVLSICIVIILSIVIYKYFKSEGFINDINTCASDLDCPARFSCKGKSCISNRPGKR